MEILQYIWLGVVAVFGVLTFFAILSLLTSLESIAKSLKLMSGRKDEKK